MATDIGTNPPASAGAEGVQETNPPGYETGDEGVSDADQGQPGQSDSDLPEGAEGESAAVDLEEVDIEGQKHAVPKALKPIIDKGLDYTRKTQEHADAVRAQEQQFAQREQEFEQRQKAAQTLHQGRAMLTALDLELQKYQGIDWVNASAQDAQATQQAWMQFQTLRDKRNGVAQQLGAAEQQFLAQENTQAQERVRKVIEKWTPDELQAVSEIGTQTYGITPQHMALFGSNPVLLQILRDAVMHQKAMKTAAAATKAPAPRVQPAQPVAQLPQGGKSVVPKSMNDSTMSVDDWMKRRTEQVTRRNRRA